MGVCEDRIEVGEDTMGVCEYFYLSVGFKASWWGFLGKLRGGLRQVKGRGIIGKLRGGFRQKKRGF